MICDECGAMSFDDDICDECGTMIFPMELRADPTGGDEAEAATR